MYYSHVLWLHVFDVNTEIFNLGVVRQFDHIGGNAVLRAG